MSSFLFYHFWFRLCAPRLYRREQIQVHLVGGGNVLAWVYIMNNLRKDAPVIESGDWVAYRKAGYRNAEADAN